MRCYLQLSSWVTPRFDRTLGVRGLMPVEFFGTMFYSPDREHSPYDFRPTRTRILMAFPATWTHPRRHRPGRQPDFLDHQR